MSVLVVNFVSVTDLHSCRAVITQLPLAVEMSLCVFIDDRSLDLALLPVAEKHMGTFLCPCQRTMKATFPIKLSQCFIMEIGFKYVRVSLGIKIHCRRGKKLHALNLLYPPMSRKAQLCMKTPDHL